MMIGQIEGDRLMVENYFKSFWKTFVKDNQ